MTNEEIINATLEWVAAVIPAVAGSTYNHVPPGKGKALPDVVGDLGEEAIVREHDEFLLGGLQQVALRVFRLGYSFMVEAGTTAAQAQTAAETLRAYAELLIGSALADHTLGGRVPFASPFLEFDYTSPFVEYEDGTRGREMNMQLTVAEPLALED